MRRVRIDSRKVMLLFGSLLLGACHEATNPQQPLRGTFVLGSVDSNPVPFLLFGDSRERLYLATDTLRFDGRGRLTQSTVTRIDSVGRPYSVWEESVSTSQYAVRGDTIYIAFSCPPNALCVPPPIGWRLADGGLVLAIRWMGGRLTLVRRYDQM